MSEIRKFWRLNRATSSRRWTSRRATRPWTAEARPSARLMRLEARMFERGTQQLRTRNQEEGFKKYKLLVPDSNFHMNLQIQRIDGVQIHHPMIKSKSFQDSRYSRQHARSRFSIVGVRLPVIAEETGLRHMQKRNLSQQTHTLAWQWGCATTLYEFRSWFETLKDFFFTGGPVIGDHLNPKYSLSTSSDMGSENERNKISCALRLDIPVQGSPSILEFGPVLLPLLSGTARQVEHRL